MKVATITVLIFVACLNARVIVLGNDQDIGFLAEDNVTDDEDPRLGGTEDEGSRQCF